MARFTLTRLASLVGILLGLSVVVFLLQAVVPADPVQAELVAFGLDDLGRGGRPDHRPHRVGGHHGLEQEHHDREAQEDADQRGQSGQGEPRHLLSIPFAGPPG